MSDRPSAWLILALGTLLLSCGDRSEEARTGDPASYGLRESADGRQVVERAVEIASRIAPSDLQPVCSWLISKSVEDSIPIYLVRREDLAPTDNAFVPSGVRSVFVSDQLIDDLSMYFFEDPVQPSLEAERYLALILLHELGHIHLGHAGSYTAPVELDPSLLNLQSTATKSDELAADEFVARRIQLAIRSDDLATSSAALWLKMALSTISMNVWRYIHIDNFGSSSTFAPRVFWDQGYSHPNLALRMLVIHSLVEQTPKSRAAVVDFQESRLRKPFQVVYEEIRSIERLAQVARVVGHFVEFGDNSVTVSYGRTETPTTFPYDPDDPAPAIAEVAEFLGLQLDAN